uniref:Transposon TX1 uncharacterized n=1 Tax=Cajanus cajan TaxID=3821 RepID=A0A151R451_CAJCA|nr:Transposon TX1 uncharacterized [Cajanus cajan]
MKFLTLNFRGLGGRLKKWEVRKLIKVHKPWLFCIQETKMEVVSRSLCESLWSHEDMGWFSKPAVGHSGGLLILWDKSKFVLFEFFMGTHYISVVGCLVGGDRWCVVGNFNAIRCEEERKGVRGFDRREEMRLFSYFVNSSGLLNPQMFGRQFTWFRNDGETMSRLDLYLVFVDFASSREGLEQWGLPRGMSNHCPVLLKTSVSEWGPKPFRVLNCWFDNIRFKPFVEDAWGRMEIRGKKCFVLREKLKELKKRLKIWNKVEFGDINKNIELLHEEIHNLESKEEEAGLEEEELSHLNQKRGELRKWVGHQCSILHQKSRVQWLREGDVNSKYFHRSIARRRQSNEIRCLDFDGELVEEKTHMHRKVKDFFESHFRESDKVRPRLGEWRFLETPFSETEIKEAVWSCDGNKCPGSDGYNLRFVKEFWDTLKEDFVGFFDEFFVNGKLVKGVNNSFITLIPKKNNP